MKVLWLVNLIIPQLSKVLKLPVNNSGGWVSGLFEDIKKESDIELTVVFPHLQEINGKLDNVLYYSFIIGEPIVYDANLEIRFKNILEEVKPDIVNIFGTEYPHSLAMTKAFNKPEKTVIHIQGLIFEAANQYTASLPERIVHRYTFRDFIRQDNIRDQQHKYYIRGTFEKDAIKSVNHIIGRTAFDKDLTYKLNPKRFYHLVNESLRDAFYKHAWNYSFCDKHTIFISQASYPIKGFHFALEAINILKKSYPDIKIYTTGKNVFEIPTFKISSYQLYIKQLIKELDLKDNVFFLNNLNEEQMCKQYLMANVALSPSAIENSSNSVAEAMILGVPVISSDVGGISSMLDNGKEGLLYPYANVSLLVEYIKRLFDDSNYASFLGKNAKAKAEKTHNREKNLKSLIKTYNNIYNL